jgi:murein L,D-transpeptidase YcbB/YkuD
LKLAANLDNVLVQSPKLVTPAGDPLGNAARRGWAFPANAGFDANGDLQITVRELEQAIERATIHGGDRVQDLLARIREEDGGEVPVVPMPPLVIEPRTIREVQRALNVVMGSALDVDGVSGRLTRETIAAFQKSAGLTSDGIYGPRTRTALTKALAAAKLDSPPDDVA